MVATWEIAFRYYASPASIAITIAKLCEGTGFGGGVTLFFGLIAILALLYLFTRISRTTLFWTTFILTRPLGANMGDLLTKPRAEHGLELSRFAASGAIALFMILCIAFLPQRSGHYPGSEEHAD